MRHISIFFLCFFCLSAEAFAATIISIAETQSLTFPTLAIPSAGTVSLAINPLNSSTSGTAQIISGIASRGTYALSSQGSGGVSISVDISVTDSGGTGLTLDSFSGFYDSTTINSFPSTTLSVPEKKPATTPLYLGSTITASTSVLPGSYTGYFTITVFVQ